MTLCGHYVIFIKGQYQLHIWVLLPRLPFLLFTKEPALEPLYLSCLSLSLCWVQITALMLTGSN